MNIAVFGLANSRDHADRIITRLQTAGFSNNEISVLLADKEGTTRRDLPPGEVPPRKDLNAPKKGTLTTEKHTKAPEGGVTGALTGGVIGGAIGLLAGIGAIALPGLGAFIAAGPLLAALSGAGVGGGLGLLVGALAGIGIPEYEAKKYESELKSGSILICVHCVDSEHQSSAKEILKKEGAKDISSTREKAAAR